jgi:hypothetical protein
MPVLETAARVMTIIGIAVSIAACPGPPRNPGLAEQCENGLEVAYEELDFAKARGFSGTVAWTQAASLLSAASVQKEFRKYPNCVDKVRRARYYIGQSQK